MCSLVYTTAELLLAASLFGNNQMQSMPWVVHGNYQWRIFLLNLILCFLDFDECTVYGTCSQSCTNTDGSYTCSCVEGYLSQPDNRSCKAKNGE